ncbi:uncharacterized protein LOC135961461 [Calliphora vicina]|uniref:uncharacterized protein LOC135961461 n=1 Tax=Calliphora vicina TaxID=7373 RepID=UPI00325A71B9
MARGRLKLCDVEVWMTPPVTSQKELLRQHDVVFLDRYFMSGTVGKAFYCTNTMSLLKSSIILINLVFMAHGYFKFSNLKCLELDKSFATIPICKLKVMQRGVVALEVYVKLHQDPVTNVSINGELLKKANGYRPFLYNMTLNFCDLMKNGKRYPFANIFVDLLAKDSNINHTCPYDHDIIVRRLVLKNEMFKLLPLPQGDYLMVIKVAAYNDWKRIFIPDT